MATIVSLTAQRRDQTGKGPARQARFLKKVPAVIYGHGRAAQPLIVDGPALEQALSGVDPESTLIELTVDGKKSRALIREIQRHPIRPDIIHVDFYEIHADDVGANGVAAEGGDRKSTRLNSSHGYISY